MVLNLFFFFNYRLLAQVKQCKIFDPFLIICQMDFDVNALSMSLALYVENQITFRF